jgi:histone H2A
MDPEAPNQTTPAFAPTNEEEAVDHPQQEALRTPGSEVNDETAQEDGEAGEQEAPSPAVTEEKPKEKKIKRNGPTKPKVMRSKKAGLAFPVGRIDRKMRKANLGKRFTSGAPVFMAGVLEYLTAEVLELAGRAAADNKKKLLRPRYLMLAIQNDDELNQLCKGVVMPEAGVLPHLNKFLIPKSKKSKKATAQEAQAKQN